MNKRRWLSLALLIPLALGGLLVWTNVLFAATPVSPGENISQSSEQSEAPQVAVFGTSLRAVWGERELNAVVVKEKTIGGDWSGGTYFEDGTDTQYQWPDVAVAPNGTTYVAYAAGDEIFVRSSNDWNNRRSVTSDDFPNPVRIAIGPDGVIWVVWRNVAGSTIRYQRSSDGGNNWSGGDVASQSGNMFAPDVAVGPDGAVHVAWRRIGGGVYSAMRLPNGTYNITGEFEDPTVDSQVGLAVDSGNNVHVAWISRQTGAFETMYTVKKPGEAFSSPIPVSNDDGAFKANVQVDASVRGGRSVAHLVWESFDGGPSIRYARVQSESCPTPSPATPGQSLPNRIFLPLVAKSGVC